ncbi:AAA family ATPase [Desulfovibrio psychrotolerans]|uniref:ATPase AAA-type core domain-containing protein n=1 Tax=Desulfovibrio psychrotolerans TaxID=415242 RepID=A0A7J0BQP6_9BACT|nr:AAA family ATPase [Desulfovibrio psychrotolerans]GFM35988.1 hypothetical protein DSM19430T_06720 [Desulfovibrio psychrotolerans]
MELQIKKWGVLRDSTIPLPGLTVITGYNATGKSTVGKLLLALVNCTIFHSNDYKPGQFGERNIFPLLDNILGQADEGANTFLKTNGPDFELSRIANRYSIPKTYINSESEIPIKAAFLIETPFVAHLSRLFQQVQSYASRDISGLRIEYPFAMNDVYVKLISKRQNITEIQERIAQDLYKACRGHIDLTASPPVFIESTSDGERKIDIKNTASGQLGLSILGKLLENGWVASDAISIFDEPESHMHPHWQLIYADLLVRCVEELGATIVVTTHTPYMLQALKVFSDQRIKDKAAFCLAERKGDHAQITVDDSPDLDRILPLMTDPMERIQLLKVWDDES